MAVVFKYLLFTALNLTTEVIIILAPVAMIVIMIFFRDLWWRKK
ncbi:MAG: hypothetical protein WCS97_03485 [Candidatus Paceibacterota bacterium]|jgi:hypothetical protein